MKSIVIVCLFTLLSIQTHGAGKWRKRFSRFLPFIAPKAHQLEKQKEEQLAEKMASLSNLELVVLDLELRGHADNVETLEKTAQLAREEIYRRISRDEKVEILKILVPALTARPGSVLSDGNLPKNPKGILQDFLSLNDGNINALVPTPKHLQDLIGATQSIDTSIKLLQEVLARGEGADEFFAIFKAIAWPSPDSKYRNALNKFFTENAEAIGKLPFSAEQAKYIRYYIYLSTTAIVFLEGALKRARGDADKFFAIFKAVSAKSPVEKFQEDLNQFFTGNAKAIGELPFTAEQVKHIIYYIYRTPTTIVFLEEALKRAQGNADEFFAIFKAITTESPSTDFQDDLNQFFTGNAKAIGELPFTAEQVKHIIYYIYRTPTTIVFLEEALKRAQGDADEFFAIFKAITTESPSTDFQDDLNQFFTGNAKAIGELPFSAEQAKYMRYHIYRKETAMVLLEGALKRTQGNADKFFAIFKAVTAESPAIEFQDDLNQFFTGNAKAIGELPFSAEQAKYMRYYIHRYETAMVLLEGALKRAQGNADKFFAIFNAVTAEPPAKIFQDALEQFFVHNAENIAGLDPSTAQMQKVGHYLPSHVSIFDIVKNRKKKREACAAGMAALLSLRPVSENTESEI